MPLTKQELESKLWQAADILRGQIDSADYKNYIFSILFLKRLSDRFNEEIQNAVALGVPRETALSDRDEHEFFVPESARWEAISAASMNLGETLNIASHAIEEQGQIFITTRAGNGTVLIEIRDTGRGISSENLKRIFDPGFTTKGFGVGTGLGLSIAYEVITRDHTGSIEAESELGKGTTFRITLSVG